jgi:uncharacterized protein (TIGR03032 family)
VSVKNEDVKMGPVDVSALLTEKYDFSSSSTPSFLEFLKIFQISLVITSYDCQRLIVFRNVSDNIDTLLVPVARPRGLAIHDNKLTVATYAEILNYYRYDQLSELGHAELQADSVFLPRNSHITGEINVHDLAWGEGGLWMVNSRFSCICTLQPDLSFKPQWWPKFLKGPTGDGAGHLNCMAMKGGKPAYATCFGAFAKGRSWRDESDLETGLLINVQTDEVVLEGLCMPHSPKLYKDKVYLCNSGHGTVICYDPQTKTTETVLEIQGFTRALTFYQDYMIVCSSKFRQSERAASLPVALKYQESHAGVYIVDMSTMSIVAFCRFDGDVSQLYDVAVIERSVQPEILGLQDPRLTELFVF